MGMLRGSSVVHVCVHNPRAFVGVIICVFSHFNKSYIMTANMLFMR